MAATTETLHQPQPRILTQVWQSAWGPMTLAASLGDSAPAGGALIGAWFEGQAHDRAGLPADTQAVGVLSPAEPAVLRQAREWLSAAMRGHDPGSPPPLAPRGTCFQLAVWQILGRVPRGSTTTYGAIAQEHARATGRRCSPRAVGGAVGRNPLSVLIPCHRVIGADGTVTGYAAGTERKIRLLRAEGVELASLLPPDRHDR